MKKYFFLITLFLSLVLFANDASASSRMEASVNSATYSATPTTVYKNTSFTLLESVRFYSKFDAPSVPVHEAILYFNIYSGSGSELINIYKVSAVYDPDTIHWNNQPSIGAKIDDQTVSSTGWFSFDVTQVVNENIGNQFAVLLTGDASTSGNLVIRALPHADHIYIEYTPAVLEKPTTPAHCYDMDTNIDVAGNLDITLNGATVGDVPGILDGGLELVNPFFATAETLSNYTASGPVTAAFWVNSPSATETWVGYQANSSTGWSLGYYPSGTLNVYSDLNSESFSFTSTGEWDFIATTWNGGAITSTINTLIFTDTLTGPTGTSANMQIASDDGAIDQLMVWNSELSTENMAWLYNGGRGRSCWELVAPTAVELSPMPTPAYFVSLESGGRGDVYLQATAGEIGIIVALFVLCALTFVALLRDSIYLLFRKLWSR